MAAFFFRILIFELVEHLDLLVEQFLLVVADLVREAQLLGHLLVVDLHGAELVGHVLVVDAQGRVLMPAELRRRLSLEAQPVWLDCYNGRINVAGKAMHEARFNRALVNLPDKVKTLDDLKQKKITLGASAKVSTTAMQPLMMNEMLGTKLDIILGYTGTGPTVLAIERGEPI